MQYIKFTIDIIPIPLKKYNIASRITETLQKTQQTGRTKHFTQHNNVQDKQKSCARYLYN